MIDLFKRMEIGPFAFSLFQLLLFALAAAGLMVAWGAFEQMTTCAMLVNDLENTGACYTCFQLKDLGVLVPR